MLQNIEHVRTMVRAGMQFQAWQVEDLLNEIERLSTELDEKTQSLDEAGQELSVVRDELSVAHRERDKLQLDIRRMTGSFHETQQRLEQIQQIIAPVQVPRRQYP